VMDSSNEEAINHIKKIKGRAEITRSAHARLGVKYGFISKFIKIVLLIGSTTSTTLIFTKNFNEEIYVLIAGFFSLTLFILSLIELVLNYEKNAETHNQAVKLFTALIRDLNRVQEIKIIDDKTLETLQDKYDWIHESSPWIPDKDFLEAKRWFKIKKEINKALDDEMNLGKSIKLLENKVVCSDDRN
jgi:hypothetical protein